MEGLIMNKKFYISTAIAYASSKPHAGNTYEIILADVIARYKRLQGFDVYFQTGTDEHGQKIQKKAIEEGLAPQAYVDKMSAEVKKVWDKMNTTYDKFVRTTDPKHKEVVAKIFKKLYDQGDIYKGKYEGLYCTPCESFITDSQLIDGKCPDCGREVEKYSEEAYFLKLSKYADRLTKHIEENPKFLQPEFRKTEILNNFIKPGLQDLCVSRTSFDWGVPVDFDEGHIVYVWVDALSNYITFLGYDVDKCSEDYKKYWPCDIHIIGKDIFRFHAIYWPIILMALKEELPKKIFGHQWLLMGDGKMSKSKGNVIYADDLVNIFGLDETRYYLLSQMPLTSDGTVSYDLIIDTINSDLANTLGNLISRTISMVNKYFDGIIENPKVNEPMDEELISFVLNAPKKLEKYIEDININFALDSIIDIARKCNKYIDETAPWILSKSVEKEERLKTVLYNVLESIRFIAVLLQPFLPDTSKKIFDQLNTNNISLESLNEFNGLKNGDKVNKSEILFERIDKEIKLEEINRK
jgi:methionyl-tRNA synthetase